MEDKTTEIINWLTKKIANKEPISPALYIEVAMKLNLLIGEEQAILYGLQQVVAQKKAELVGGDNSVSKAKILIEATDDYKNYLIQKAKIEQIIEYIRIAKIQSRMASEEYKGY